MFTSEIELAGKNRRIKFDYNALADLEKEAGAGIAKLFTDETNIGFNTIRLLVWSGLKHEERGLTLNRAGLMIEQYIEEGGELKELVEKFADALKACSVFTANSKNA